jgi:hypothetical protein
MTLLFSLMAVAMLNNNKQRNKYEKTKKVDN